jgi:hypothetical protein
MPALYSRVLTFVPAITPAAYDDGDQIGAVNDLAAALDDGNDSASVLSLTIVDKAKQNAPIDVLLFSDSPTLVSADNAPLDISAANMAAKFLGRIRVTADDYSELANCSVATINGVGLMLEATTPAKKILHAVVQSRGTPTYASATDLVVKLGVLQD